MMKLDPTAQELFRQACWSRSLDRESFHMVTVIMPVRDETDMTERAVRVMRGQVQRRYEADDKEEWSKRFAIDIESGVFG